MILTGTKISREVANGGIIITPFLDEQINPNSYDFRLGKQIGVYKNLILDAKVANEIDTIEIGEDGFLLQSNRLYLGHSVEVMGSNKYVPIIRGKSSTGRIGLFVHITADLIDIGSVGQISLMMHAVQPVKIYPNMRVGQITFWKTQGEIVLYDGKYQGSRGPQPSKGHADFARSIDEVPA